MITQSRPSSSPGPFTMAVTSGKGGVGKSNVVVNLAIALARTRNRVAIVDADFGLGNLDVLLGLSPQRHLAHFVNGECDMRDIVLEGPCGVRVVPGGSGLRELTRLTVEQWRRLDQGVRELAGEVDFLLVDTGAGLAGDVVDIASAFDRAMVVTTIEPTSVVDAYATVKVLTLQPRPPRIGILVNGARDAAEGETVFRQLDMAARRFLDRPLDFFGFVDDDPTVREAVLAQRAVVDCAPGAPASRAFRRLANRVAALVPRGGPGLRLVPSGADMGKTLPRVEASQCA